jgi:hypothetical protein
MTRNAKGQDAARDTFAKIGDDEAEVVNTSGTQWPGAQMRPRDRAITPPPPARALPHRSPMTIDAETGQALGDLTERAASDAARHLSIRREMVDQSHPSARPMLRHIFGIGLPGRDRDR